MKTEGQHSAVPYKVLWMFSDITEHTVAGAALVVALSGAGTRPAPTIDHKMFLTEYEYQTMI